MTMDLGLEDTAPLSLGGGVMPGLLLSFTSALTVCHRAQTLSCLDQVPWNGLILKHRGVPQCVVWELLFNLNVPRIWQTSRQLMTTGCSTLLDVANFPLPRLMPLTG
jgi:hypothetical protein